MTLSSLQELMLVLLVITEVIYLHCLALFKILRIRLLMGKNGAVVIFNLANGYEFVPRSLCFVSSC